jgi:hypothetical protein
MGIARCAVHRRRQRPVQARPRRRAARRRGSRPQRLGVTWAASTASAAWHTPRQSAGSRSRAPNGAASATPTYAKGCRRAPPTRSCVSPRVRERGRPGRRAPSSCAEQRSQMRPHLETIDRDGSRQGADAVRPYGGQSPPARGSGAATRGDDSRGDHLHERLSRGARAQRAAAALRRAGGGPARCSGDSASRHSP